MVLVFCTLINIYVCNKFHFNPYNTFKYMAWKDIHYNKIIVQGRLLCKYTEYEHVSCALPFLSLPSIYKPSFSAIPFVLFKIWPRQATIMKNG